MVKTVDQGIRLNLDFDPSSANYLLCGFGQVI